MTIVSCMGKMSFVWIVLARQSGAGEARSMFTLSLA
jgi:hypothetical protein